MIKINNNEYSCNDINISFGSYSVVQNNIKRDGYSLIIYLRTNEVCILIETTYDKEWLIDVKNNVSVDISKYISDINYVDYKGWLSLIMGTYKCILSKIEGNLFNIELICCYEEGNEIFDICINENIKIN